VWVPRTPQDPRNPLTIPQNERYYFLEERYPKYGNLVPRDIATREIFDICVNDGLSVDKERLAVYLDLTHIPRAELNRKLGGILEIYEKFQGVDPRANPMKIFPAVHYSMGGLWCDYAKAADGGLVIGSPQNQVTNIPNLYAIGECDYQYHGANRLGANSLLSCIFSGLITAPGIVNLLKGQKTAAAELPSTLFDGAKKKHQERHNALLNRPKGGENPYLVHQELGFLMTKVATVVRQNDQLADGLEKVKELHERAKRCSLSDTGNWTNQNVVFTKALVDMFPIALAIVQGALQRDECRGAHFKPAFDKPSLKATDPAGKRKEAEAWCDAFDANNEKFLKSTIATWDGNNLTLSYEDVDTSLITPRPRLYGLVGAEEIEKVWKERAAAKKNAGGENGNGSSSANKSLAGAAS
jgi:succinate dehydrogenase / fumarate reductase flavoprotein subunit